MKKENLLLIIDPQNDFVDTEGTMYVPGAEQAIKNLCRWISINKKNIDSIIVTQDTHRSYHIGHSVFWKEMPPQFTNITSEDVKNGTYTPIDRGFFCTKDEVIKYLEAVEQRGGKHTIWPEHCLLGSWGQAFPKDLVEALNLWSLGNSQYIGKEYIVIQKGEDPKKEMYSALSFADGTSESNGLYIAELINPMRWDNIYIAGFAKDYCVAETLKDLVKISNNNKTSFIFLDDCMASINKNSENLKIFEDVIENGLGKYYR